jgi:hypothetical protein
MSYWGIIKHEKTFILGLEIDELRHEACAKYHKALSNSLQSTLSCLITDWFTNLC